MDPFTEIEKTLTELLNGNLLEKQPGFSSETDLFEAGLDSLSIMQLMVLIEERLSVQIPTSAVTNENFRTVKSLAALVQRTRA